MKLATTWAVNALVLATPISGPPSREDRRRFGLAHWRRADDVADR